MSDASKIADLDKAMDALREKIQQKAAIGVSVNADADLLALMDALLDVVKDLDRRLEAVETGKEPEKPKRGRKKLDYSK